MQIKYLKISLFFLSFTYGNCFSQGIDSNRYMLNSLLNERKLKFEVYTTSLNNRTGFFGNKTKKDILHSNAILIEIVKTDNRVISTLNRVIDFRNFEKTTTNYDLQSRNEHLNNLLQATDTLSKQVLKLKEKNAALDKKNQTYGVFLFLLIIVAITTLFFLFKQKLRRS